MLDKFKKFLFSAEQRLARLLFKRSKGVVFVTQNSLGAKETEERNIAGSRLIAHFTRHQIKTLLLNGRKAKAYQKLRNGDIVDIYVRPNDLNIGDIVGAVLGAILVIGSFGVTATAIGYSLLVSTGVSILVRLLTPTPESADTQRDEVRSRSSIRGSENTVSKGIMPVLFGETIQTPFYGQRPYRLVNDGSPTNKYLQYFASNFNDVNIYEEKLGETPIGNFSTDYLSITRSFGGSSFIGFENVLSVAKEEQLTVDNQEGVSQASTFTYNQATTTTTVEYEGIIEFTDVDVLNWGDKEFMVTVNVDTAGGNIALTENFTILVGDLTLVSGTTYRATVNKVFTENATEILDTRFEPVSDTRITVQENDNELDTVLISEELTTDDYNNTETLNNGINKYTGVVTEVIETSPKNTSEVDFIISFPQGLYRQKDDGSISRRTTSVDIEYKLVGAGSYSALDTATALYIRDIDGVKQHLSGSTTSVSGSTVHLEAPDDVKQANELFYRTIGAELPSGQYTFRVRSADLLEKSTRDVGTVTMSEFNFFVDGDPVETSILPSLNQIAVEAIAYKALSGELKKYNYVGKLECPIWNGTDWNTTAETRNPAAIVRYLLTDTKVNPRAEDVSFLDNDSLVALYDFCEDNDYFADGLITDGRKVGNVVAKILDNCKAGFTLVEGKYVFVFDDDTAEPIDMFTPHNSWDFTWTPNAGRIVDALRVKFINEDTYTEDEISLYYYDGDVYETPKSGTSDVDYEFLVEESQFINNRDHLVDRYTYSLRNIQEKRNSFKFSVNLEGLNRRLFDRVYIANTCDMTDEITGNIKEVLTSGGNITGFKLYSEVDIPASASISIRSIDSVNETSVINVYPVTNSGITDTVTIDPIVNSGIIKGKGSISGFTSGYSWDYDGDLFEIGSGKIYEALITNITYNDDLTATIEAREA